MDQNRLFALVAAKSPWIISKFNYVYALILSYLLLGSWAIYSQNYLATFFYTNAIRFGNLGLLVLVVIVIPGILGRLGIEIKLTRTITLFRRQLGITTFLLVLTHFVHLRFIFILTEKIKPPLSLFETMGFLAFSLLFLLFLTSNNTSVKTLGPWWKRLHRLIYVILWLVVIHTGLQRISPWSVLIFTVASLEIFSLGYSYFKKGKI